MIINNKIAKKILSLALVFLLSVSPIYTLYSTAEPEHNACDSRQQLVFTSKRKLGEFVRVYNDRVGYFGKGSIVGEHDIFFKDDFLKVMGFLRFDSLAPTGFYTKTDNDNLVELFWQIAEDNNI